MPRRSDSPLVLLVLSATLACQASAPVRSAPRAGVAPVAVEASEPTVVASSDSARLLVRRAAMDVVVDDVGRAAARVQAVLAGTGGYVERGERAEHSASFTLRVPEAMLDATMDSLATLGSVASRRVSAEDVTEQAIDLDAKLQSLLVTRDRLRKLHDSATSVADVIAVERELARVQGEVDSLEGRLKHLRSSAALASLDLSIRQKIVLGPLGIIARGLGTLITKLFVIR